MTANHSQAAELGSYMLKQADMLRWDQPGEADSLECRALAMIWLSQSHGELYEAHSLTDCDTQWHTRH